MIDVEQDEAHQIRMKGGLQIQTRHVLYLRLHYMPFQQYPADVDVLSRTFLLDHSIYFNDALPCQYGAWHVPILSHTKNVPCSPMPVCIHLKPSFVRSCDREARPVLQPFPSTQQHPSLTSLL